MSAIEAIGVGYRVGGATLVDSVSLALEPGELLALVGPNGAGKSTLLALLSGQLAPSAGTVICEGRSLAAWRPRELARARAVLSQDNAVAFPFTVRQVVSMGREPWRGTDAAALDDEVIADAMAAADVTHLAERAFPSLSGGERARASFARVLAQRARTVLLDEPTAALDLRHQEELLTMARGLAQGGSSVVVVVHDLNLAAAFAHRVALMDGGAIVRLGSVEAVLDSELLSSVYGLAVQVREHADGLHVSPVRRHP